MMPNYEINRDETYHAVIDMGTNTFNLLIASWDQGKIKPQVQMELPVMLGEGGGLKSGFISDKAVARAIEVLRTYAACIHEYEVKSIVAVGTSALRDAENGSAITEMARSLLGVEPQVISGNQEAEFIYRGVEIAADWADQTKLVMDIGGGSTEFIIGRNQEILWKKSYLLGAARLKYQFNPANPISEENKTAIQQFLQAELTELEDVIQQFNVRVMVGSAGSFDTLRDVLSNDLLMELSNYSDEVKIVKAPAFKMFCGLMYRSDSLERRKLSGIPVYRNDMITSATVLMEYVFNAGKFDKLLVSSYALKEGLFTTLNP